MWDLIVSVPDHYLSFYFDQVLRLPKYVSFLRSGPRRRLLVNLVPINARIKNCETHPKPVCSKYHNRYPCQCVLFV